METTDNPAIQELTARVTVLEKAVGAFNRRAKQQTSIGGWETPPIDFTSVGGRLVHPPQSFEGKPPVDLSPAYGETGRRIFSRRQDTSVQDRIVSPAAGSIVVTSERDGWMTKVTWSDGTISWHCRRDEVQRVKIDSQNQVVAADPCRWG